ncbi:MAG: hypothetical protein EA381_14170 [Planctomycetaceae bacterium]|nr:MAG: hypothetical protein EA381_14170 [Planctomycetaceae bacterium]
MTHSNHPDQSLINGYVACELPAEIAAEIEAHLAGCDRCLELLIDAVDRGVSPKWLQERLDALAAHDQPFRQVSVGSSTYGTSADAGFLAGELRVPGVGETPSDRAGPEKPFSRQGTNESWLDDLSANRPLSEVGRYRVGRKLGQGGMGVVFEATDRVTGRPVAMKFVQGLGPGVAWRNRVLNEARAMARLSHPHIVSVLDVLVHDDRPVLVMERVDGVSLDRWQAKRMISSRWAAELVRKLALAIHHAHDHGVVHRDLKPSNVLLVGSDLQQPDTAALPSLEPKVTDFGVSRILDRLTQQTHAGELLGTPAYMAPEMIDGQTAAVFPEPDFEPEQRRPSLQFSSAIDIYGLGTILYELLTGRPPFTSTDPVITLALVRDADPIPPRALRPELAADIETICLKCLEKQPDKRYESAVALATDLTAFLENRPVQARPLGPLGRVARWSRRNRVGVAVAATAAVTLLLISIGSIAFAKSQQRLRGEADRVAAFASWSAQQTIDQKRQAHDAWHQLFDSFRIILDLLDSYEDDASDEDLRGLREIETREMIVRVVGEYWSQVAAEGPATLADVQLLNRILWVQNRLDRPVLSDDTIRRLLDRVIPQLDRLEREAPHSIPVLKMQLGFRDWQAFRYSQQGNWESVFEQLQGTTRLIRQLLELIPGDERTLQLGVHLHHNLATAAKRTGKDEAGRDATLYLLELHRELHQDWASDDRMRLSLATRLLDVGRHFRTLIGEEAARGLLLETKQLLEEPLPDDLVKEGADSLRRIDLQLRELEQPLGE